MWLLPAINAVSSAALRIFYRLHVEGDPSPMEGPVLLVANHPNSLVDPGAVAAVAGRPVRFLAKAPLFTDPKIGWLIRASGSIPVYRRTDDPDLVERNEDAFGSAHQALAAGAAVGIFPEGLSHSEPGMAPLKTGAARIALGAAALIGGPFPIVPVGLSFREKGRFRSEALAMRGRPVEWEDLAGDGQEPEAVRDLTARIDRALREVTVNLESWEDAPLVQTAEEIYRAETGAAGGAGAAVERMVQLGEALRTLRSRDGVEWRDLARDLKRHDRLLRRLRVRPHQLAHPGRLAAIEWLPRQAGWFAVLAVPALAGAGLYTLPYLTTAALERASRPAPDIRATHKLLTGAVIYLLWTVLLAFAMGFAFGAAYGAGALVLVPVLGIVWLAFYDRWRRAEGEAYRFFLRARRRELLTELKARQREIATRMEALRHDLMSARPTTTPS